MTTEAPPPGPDFIAGLHRGATAASHFTIIANAALRDPQLSFAAKGLFANLMTHRAGWLITEEFLSRQSTDGVKTVRRLLGELRERGYIYRGGRPRYPKGTFNAAGKDISGALGPYQWFVTDKAEEIAVILARYAEEQHAATLADEPEDSPGHDQVPPGQVVLTSGNAAPVDNSNLPPQRAASADQPKQGVSARDHNRPEPPGGFGTSLEDQPKKTRGKKTTGGAPPPDPRRTTAPSGPSNAEGPSPKPRGTQRGHQQGDHKRVPVRLDVQDWAQVGGELAKLLAMANSKLTDQTVQTRAIRAVLDATAKPALKATGEPDRASCLRASLSRLFDAKAADAGVMVDIEWTGEARSDAA